MFFVGGFAARKVGSLNNLGGFNEVKVESLMGMFVGVGEGEVVIWVELKKGLCEAVLWWSFGGFAVAEVERRLEIMMESGFGGGFMVLETALGLLKETFF